MTADPFPVPALDPQAYALLAEAGFDETLFNPAQHRACERVERHALALAIDLARQLALGPLLAEPRTADDLVAAGAFAPGVRPVLGWLLERLAAEDILARAGGAYVLRRPLPEADPAAFRAAALAADPAYAPAYALLDEAAALVPRVARGETSGERALFLRVRLWVDYFSNAHPYYALNNRVTAHAAAARLPAGATVLEVGAGLGSATEALLEALETCGALARLVSYRATEPVAFFRRRAERALAQTRPGVAIAFESLDLNRPWGDQGVAAASVQLVFGVNVFHLARDLDCVLAEAHRALVPGGWLVVGEGMRSTPGRPVGAELPFQLLESFTAVTLDPVTRPTPGFLTAEHWIAALARAGFAQTELVPDVVRLRRFYPGLLAGAVCGRRA